MHTSSFHPGQIRVLTRCFVECTFHNPRADQTPPGPEPRTHGRSTRCPTQRPKSPTRGRGLITGRSVVPSRSVLEFAIACLAATLLAASTALAADEVHWTM